MFMYASPEYTDENQLDLSGWDVSKVTSYDKFIYHIKPVDSIISPNFRA